MKYPEYAAILGGAKQKGWTMRPLRLTNTGTDAATIALDDSASTGTVLKTRTTADGAWQAWDLSAITLQPGEFVEIAGDNREAGAFLGQFQMTGEAIAASGSIMSLIYGENMTEAEEKIMPFCAFYNEEDEVGIFYGCIGLTSAPELPATTLAEGCYNHMFSGCTGLTSAPELPATQLAEGCYDHMFSGCTGLTSAPELPATTLADYCYSGMFSGCTGLTSAPELPATTLADYCYSGIFDGCTGLTSAPELPATQLAEGCYYGMFSGCTGLTSAPELPATTLAEDCYNHMFSSCTGLAAVTVGFASWDDENNATDNWLDGVAADGTFTCPADLDTTTRDASHVPAGWTVQNAA